MFLNRLNQSFLTSSMVLNCIDKKAKINIKCEWTVQKYAEVNSFSVHCCSNEQLNVIDTVQQNIVI